MYTKRNRIIIHLLLSVFVVSSVYMGIKHFNKANRILRSSTLNSKGIGKQALELGDLKFTKTKVTNYSTHHSRWVTYATVSNLDRETPSPQLDGTILGLNKRQHNRVIYGLQGHPSFMIKQDDISFWRSQILLQIIFYFGGLFIVGILYILYFEINYRKDNKLFIPEIKNIILSFSLLFSFGALLKLGLDFRLFNYLNNHFYLGEPMPPISKTLLYLGIAMFFAAVILQRAVKLQEEQDLTI